MDYTHLCKLHVCEFEEHVVEMVEEQQRWELCSLRIIEEIFHKKAEQRHHDHLQQNEITVSSSADNSGYVMNTVGSRYYDAAGI